MERNSSSSDSSYSVHVKDEPECLYTQEVRKTEVVVEVEHIKEEQEWDSGASCVSEALEPSDLYPGCDVKHEVELGPEGLQPADIAFTLYALTKDHLSVCPDFQVFRCLDFPLFSPRGRISQPILMKFSQALDVKTEPEVKDCVVMLDRVNLEAQPLSTETVTHHNTRQSVTSYIANNTDLAHEYSDTNTEKEYYVCAICNWRFKLKSRLKEHVMVHIHVSMEEESSVEIGNSKNKQTDVKIRLHKCPECNNLYKSQKNMADHIQSTHCIYDCPHCPLSYTYRKLQHYLKNVHPSEGSEVVKQRVLSAETAEDRGHHDEHAYARIASPLLEVTAFECGTCNKKYKGLRQLKRHARTHSRVKSSRSTGNIWGHGSAPAKTMTVTESDEEIDVVSLGPQLPLAISPRRHQRTWHTRHRKRFPSAAVATAAPRYGLRARRRCRVYSDVSDTDPHTHTHTKRRESHNVKERFRRYCLKKLFDTLREQIPKVKDRESAPKVLIIREATALCHELREEQKLLRKQQHKLVTEFRRLSSKAKRVRL